VATTEIDTAFAGTGKLWQPELTQPDVPTNAPFTKKVNV
jgi:hypothetical protein